MYTFQDCQQLINQRLNEIKLPGLPAQLYDPIRYMMNLEAKRLRPSLVIMSCNIFSEDIEPAIYPALAIEVFHNFTLVHDDIMDKSDMRRNHATVHKKWCPSVAILSGDAMLIKAYELLTHPSVPRLNEIIPVFNQTALQVCEGQQYDMDYEQSEDVTIGDYMKMVEYKTAVLLASSLKIGALIGGAKPTVADQLYAYGKSIGIAFQLQDDLLDVYSDTAVFGKLTGNDIVSNKKTILLVEALQSARGQARDVLIGWLKRKDFERNEKINAFRSVYDSLQLENKINEKIKKYHQQAVDYLEKLPVAPERKTELLKFSAFLMNRIK